MHLYEKIYGYVLEEIKDGRLKHGDRVPSEKELAEQFKVSRITSKKALEKLDQEHLIERIPGRGSFVADPGTALGAVPLGEPSPVTAVQGQRPRLVGLIVPDFDSSYGAQIVSSVEARCAVQGCLLLLKQTYGQRDQEEQAIQAFVRLGVDGLIVLPVHGEYYNGEILRLVLDRFPLVLVDRYLKGIPASTVHTDNRRAAAELTEYLLDRGHQQIAFLSPPVEHTSAIEDRMQGFADACVARGIQVPPEYYLTTLYSTLPVAAPHDNTQRDYDALQAFVTRYPEVSGFVACEYNIARIAAGVLRSLGRWQTNSDALVCFDAVDDLFGSGSLTHIRQDEASLGRTAVDALLRLMNGDTGPHHAIIGHRLLPQTPS